MWWGKKDKTKTVCDYCGNDSRETPIWHFCGNLRVCVKCMKKSFDITLKGRQ
jgi:hypothetical protein